MSIHPAAVVTGKCFITRNGEVRKVIAVSPDGGVRYVPRGAPNKLGDKSCGREVTVALGEFAREVEHQVSNEGLLGS